MILLTLFFHCSIFTGKIFYVLLDSIYAQYVFVKDKYISHMFSKYLLKKKEKGKSSQDDSKYFHFYLRSLFFFFFGYCTTFMKLGFARHCGSWEMFFIQLKRVKCIYIKEYNFNTTSSKGTNLKE